MAEADRDKWDARYLRDTDRVREASSFLTGLADLLPTRGRAIDVAGGAGQDALWLARRGLDVTLADVSTVALEIARKAADGAGLTLRTVAADLEEDPFPAGPWVLIVCTYFLWRPLFAAFARELAPGGLLVAAHPTSTNLQRHEHPGPRFLLEDGELPRLIAGLDCLSHWEGWTTEGRHEARIVARRRRTGTA